MSGIGGIGGSENGRFLPSRRDESVSSSYPFEDGSTPEGFPNGAVADLCVVVPSREGDEGLRPVELGCLHIGPGVVSLSLLVGGAPALFASEPASSVDPGAPVPMKSVMDGVSGIVAFGGVDFSRPGTLRARIPVSETAVFRPVVGRLARFVQEARDSELSGNVGLVLPSGLSVSFSDDGAGRNVARFSSDESLRARVMTDCGRSSRSNAQPVPVLSLNGVRPDADGRIAVVFTR